MNTATDDILFMVRNVKKRWCPILVALAVFAFGVTPVLAAPTANSTAAQMLLAQKCASCHGPDKQEGGLRLDSRDAALAGGDSGPAIVPGDIQKSLVIQAVRHTHEDLEMPPKEKLKESQIAILEEWVRDGAVWPNAVLVLFDDEDAFIGSLNKGDSSVRREYQDAASGQMSVAVGGRERFSEQIGDWSFPLREHPVEGEYRYLRLAWKKVGAGAVMLEVANHGHWPAARQSPPPGGRYVAGQNTSGLDAISIHAAAPAEWAFVTIDLWRDLGDAELTGLSLMNFGGGESRFDQILLARNTADLESYQFGSGRRAFRSASPLKRIGDAWTDPENPVVKTFGGARLDLWSLQKPSLLPPPAVADEKWCRGAIDHFVVAKLNEAGLAPSLEADRRTLIRRLYFDLLGLPPTLEEVRAFINDQSSDAYEQLVDRLLASPRYGERWGRHWLDVVRYADTNGCERDELRPTAYRYRDYVIRSFNADKPYDEFIREQLAGDELVDGAPQSAGDVDRLIATGFLRAGLFDSTAPIFQEEARARDQLMADLVNTTCSAFLGLTIGCANCHDHKYDPLLQSDHFRLRAFFAAVRNRDELPIDLAGEQAEIIRHNAAVDVQAVGIEKQIAELIDPVRQALVAKRTAELPQEIRDLLAIAADKRDDATRERLKPFEEQLSVGSEDLQRTLSETQRQQQVALNDQLAEARGKKRRFQTALAMTDDGTNAQPTHIFFQGDHTSPRDEVTPGIPAVFDPNPVDIQSPRQGTTGRRLALANWIASAENPYTSRVMVNRLWQHHFAEPLVGTPNDFGYSGARPTHPELLDWLANEFIHGGWSIKHMHRLMVNSSVYRQASRFDAAKHSADPENHRLWRQNIRRLDADAMRDAMLVVSGRLQPYAAGKPLWPAVPEDILHAQPGLLEELKGENAGRPQGWYTDPESATDVRSVFLIQKRSIPIPFLQVFDVPDPNTSCARRDVTTVAPQALNLLNSEFATRLAREFSARLEREAGADPAAQIQRGIEIAFGRDATALENAQLLRLRAGENGLVDVCRAIVNLNEFVYID